MNMQWWSCLIFILSMGSAIALSCDVTSALRPVSIIVMDYTIIVQHYTTL
jgi:hypothetical protein